MIARDSISTSHARRQRGSRQIARRTSRLTSKVHPRETSWRRERCDCIRHPNHDDCLVGHLHLDLVSASLKQKVGTNILGTFPLECGLLIGSMTPERAPVGKRTVPLLGVDGKV
jgi:hypothetical protein